MPPTHPVEHCRHRPSVTVAPHRIVIELRQGPPARPLTTLTTDHRLTRRLQHRIGVVERFPTYPSLYCGQRRSRPENCPSAPHRNRGAVATKSDYPRILRAPDLSSRPDILTMKFTSGFFLLAAAATAMAADATTTTSSSSTSTSNTILVTGTSLPVLVTETESCAVLCYQAACLDSGCSPADFDCVCGNPHSLVVKMGLCVGSDCDDKLQFDSGEWIASVCNVYDKSPGSAAIASASSLIVAEISAAAATATDNPVPTGTIDNASATAETGTNTGTGSASTSTATAGASRLGAPGVLVPGSFGPLGSWLTPALALVGGGAVLVAAMI